MLLYVKLFCMLILFLISNFGSCQLGMKIERDRKVIDRIIHPFAPLRPATPTGTGRPHLFGEEGAPAGSAAPEAGSSGPTTTTDKTSGLPVPLPGPQPTLAPPQKLVTIVHPDGSSERRPLTAEEKDMLSPMSEDEFRKFQLWLKTSNTTTNWKTTVGKPRKIANSWGSYASSG